MKYHFQIWTKPQENIFQLLGWQRFKTISECYIRGDQEKQAFLFIAGEDINWYNPSGRQFDSISQNQKYIYHLIQQSNF